MTSDLSEKALVILLILALALIVYSFIGPKIKSEFEKTSRSIERVEY